MHVSFAAPPNSTGKDPTFPVFVSGAMAEWLCRGLQILPRRFDSGSRLQHVVAHLNGAYAGLKTSGP